MPLPITSQKLVQIIVNIALENKIEKKLKEVGASGFTTFDVRGDGLYGFQSGHIDGDTNVLIMAVEPAETVEKILSEMNALIERGHHLTVFSSHADVLMPRNLRT